jgi:hypothetical protein
MLQPDNLPVVCRVHRNGRPLIGMQIRSTSGAQSDLIGAPEPMCIEAAVVTQIGGYFPDAVQEAGAQPRGSLRWRLPGRSALAAPLVIGVADSGHHSEGHWRCLVGMLDRTRLAGDHRIRGPGRKHCGELVVHARDCSWCQSAQSPRTRHRSPGDLPESLDLAHASQVLGHDSVPAAAQEGAGHAQRQRPHDLAGLGESLAPAPTGARSRPCPG